MTTSTLKQIPWKLERDAPPFEGNDIKSPEGLYRYIYKKYTKKGDKIFDPFVGLGTAMFVAEEMERIPFGMEATEQKFEWVAGQLENWTHMICDDTNNVSKYDLPKMDLIVTCPPFMEAHIKWNPICGGDPKQNGYDKYLKRLENIFKKLTPLLKKNGTLIVEVMNITNKGKFTPLTHDIATLLQKNYKQIDEETILWKNPTDNIPLTTLLIFKKK